MRRPSTNDPMELMIGVCEIHGTSKDANIEKFQEYVVFLSSRLGSFQTTLGSG